MTTLYTTLSISSDSSCAQKCHTVERRENGGRAQFATCHPVLTPRRIYTYSPVHVCAYTCPILNKGAHIEGLAVAGYIGGCGVNNTSRSSYIGDSLAWLRRTSELEQERKLIKTDVIFLIRQEAYLLRAHKMHKIC